MGIIGNKLWTNRRRQVSSKPGKSAGRRCKRTKRVGQRHQGSGMTGLRRFVGRDGDRRARSTALLGGICTRSPALDLQEGAVSLSQRVSALLSLLSLSPCSLTSSSSRWCRRWLVPQSYGFLGNARQAASGLGRLQARGRPKWDGCRETLSVRGGAGRGGRKL